MATKIHIEIDQATDLNKTIFHVRDVYGNIVDMSKQSGICMLRKNYTAINGYSIAVTFNANGDVILTDSANNTANIVPGRYVYDVVAKDPTTGDVERIVEGFAYVSPAISWFGNTAPAPEFEPGTTFTQLTAVLQQV
jgi:hypothetical protein